MDNQKKYGKLIDSGFDWLTFTSTPKMDEHLEFQKTALEFVDMLRDSGVKVEEKTINNYEGFKAGETFFGRRTDSAMWRTSGVMSRHVAAFARSAGITPRCTRADLQQTIETAGGETARLGRILADARKMGVGDAKTERQKRAEFYEADVVTGAAFGSRSSAIFCRIYRADLRHPARFSSPALRCEAEFKAERSQQIWEQYYCATNDVALSCSYVAGEFLKRGISEPLQAEFAPCRLPPIGRSGSDEKCVHWIKNTVCKTIARLVKAGYADELTPAIMAALSPVPDVQLRHSSLEAEIQSIDWEMIIHGRSNCC